MRLVQIKKSAKGASLVGAINIPMTEKILDKDKFKNKAQTANLIKEACRKAKPHIITAKKIVTALPETFVFSKTIQLPKMTKKEYDEAIPIEAAQFMPVPIAETYLDYQILMVHPDEPLVDVLVVATPKRLVDDYVELATLAGFELAAVETKPLAIGRALLSSNEKNGTLIMEIGTEFTRISVWDSSNIRLTTMIGIGQNQLLEALGIVSQNLVHEKAVINASNIKDITPLISEISAEAINSIRYHQNRDYKPKEVKRILICGAGANIDGLDKQLEKNIKIKTSVACPVFQDGNKLGTEFTTAFGLAMRSDF